MLERPGAMKQKACFMSTFIFSLASEIAARPRRSGAFFLGGESVHFECAAKFFSNFSLLVVFKSIFIGLSLHFWKLKDCEH